MTVRLLKIRSFAVLLIVISCSSTSTALDINSSYDLRYFSSDDPSFWVETGGKTSIYGDLTMNDNTIRDIDELSNFFGHCDSGEVVHAISDDGTFTCEPVEIDSDPQNLSEILTEGNVANTSIDMGGNEITNIDWENSDTGPGSGLDADTLDGVELTDINWSDVELAESHVAVSHLGTADSDLNMAGNNITGIGGLNDCSAEEALLGDGTCGTAGGGDMSLSDVLSNGIGAGSHDIDMETNDLDNVRTLTVETVEPRQNEDLCFGNC